jgi:hypothetical protein
MKKTVSLSSALHHRKVRNCRAKLNAARRSITRFPQSKSRLVRLDNNPEGKPLKLILAQATSLDNLLWTFRLGD